MDPLPVAPAPRLRRPCKQHERGYHASPRVGILEPAPSSDNRITLLVTVLPGPDGDGAEDGGSNDGDDTGGIDDGEDPGPAAGPDVATSPDHPPTGLWTMTVQYGAVGEPVSPTIPLQVEFREDGSAFAWVCAGAPSDGSFDEVCAAPARGQCLAGTYAWSGVRFEFSFPKLEEGFTVEEMGRITPDGQGNLLLSYIKPTYSGALFAP
jgi:hypothetical protein